MEQGRMTFKARVRPIPSIEAIDPRLAEEIRAINAVFDSAKKALDAERKSVQCKSIPPTTVEEFPC